MKTCLLLHRVLGDALYHDTYPYLCAHNLGPSLFSHDGAVHPSNDHDPYPHVYGASHDFHPGYDCLSYLNVIAFLGVEFPWIATFYGDFLSPTFFYLVICPYLPKTILIGVASSPNFHYCFAL